MWIICERKTDARDNGYHFFRYLCRNHPEINAAYIIDKNSCDYSRAAELGRIIQPNTFEHMLSFACAGVCISTHIMGYAPDTYRFALLDAKLGLVHTKKVFLQHGIIETDLKELYYPDSRLDLFVCTAIPEFNFVCGNFRHPDGVVQRLGLCRYDRLLTEHRVKKQILIMPTWRIYLRNLSKEEFIKSDYYKNYSELINCSQTADILKKYGYEMVLYLHYELQPYAGLFKSGNPDIKIAEFKDYDVQNLLMDSAVLITDYSSILFDFAYMQKPSAYFWFDEKAFFERHYKKGYFDCRADGFGPVFESLEPLLDYIRRCLENNAQMPSEYKKRTEEFFDYGFKSKTTNCERTYDAISRIINKQ